MTHTLPELPYALDALNPHLSRQTLEFHHGKHHLNYVNTLNTLIVGTRFEDASLETMICEAEGAIFNNAAQFWNHNFYFDTFAPNPKAAPTGELLKALERDFGSFDAFKEQFTKAAATLFGSGWAWLAKNAEGKLVIVQESNAGNPLRNGLQPLLTCDVWEHAYYIDYQNRRADYIKEFWALVDWAVVEARF
ncbi:MAG: superoxide dismutase [Bacteroides sp.]